MGFESRILCYLLRYVDLLKSIPYWFWKLLLPGSCGLGYSQILRNIFGPLTDCGINTLGGGGYSMKLDSVLARIGSQIGDAGKITTSLCGSNEIR